jgi:single-stranded-DNA-specific exonuclease
MPAWLVQPIDEKIGLDLSRELLVSPLQARLLISSGISTVAEATRFLSPSYDFLHDPFLFREMREAAAILHRAITGGKRILVHGDYDADGVCGTSLLYEALRRLGADVHYFVPDRAKDGYGLAMRVMERGLETGLGCVISVDCGSSDGDVVSYLARNGVEVIITDHHETAERIPDAAAFLNPKLPDEPYPFKELTGSGVAFKLLQGLEKYMGIGLSLKDQLDLVAIGTLGDYAVLRDENRVLASLGLLKLQEWLRPGFKALRDESGLGKAGVTARQICFTIVPRLNSPGRIGSARDCIKLLLTEDAAEAARMAREIEDKNRRRREHDSRVTEQASHLAEETLRRSERSALVFASPAWHEGVVGIGAARLAENFNVPSVLIALRDGIGKGSARSAGLVNIKRALEWCSDYLEEFGGHREAGGFSIREEHIPDFQRKFEEAVEELADGVKGSGTLKADAEIPLEDCTFELIGFIERMAPFGPGNHEPVFLVHDLEVLPESRIVGDGHLKLIVRDVNRAKYDLIGFSLGSIWNPDEIIGSRVDALVHLRKNTFMGKIQPQIQITALRPAVHEIPE